MLSQQLLEAKGPLIVGTLAALTIGALLVGYNNLQKRVKAARAKGVIVTELLLHPIKSCKGISVTSAAIGKFGFEFDRLWMLVKEEDHTFVTQREYPQLALVEPVLKGKGKTYAEGGEMVVSGPGLPKLVIPFRKTLEGMPKITTDVWKNSVIGFDEGDNVANWFSKFLGFRVRLIIKCVETVRHLNPKNTPPESLLDADQVGQTAFADGYPFLVASTTSLQAVNERLPKETKPRTIYHFRPNIVVSPNPNDASAELTPFAEDSWKTLRIGNETFYIASHCTRCQMPGNDITTGGASDPQITKTMMKFRRVDKGKKYEPCFGMNAISKRVTGVVSVGDVVEVVEDGIVHDGKQGIWRPGASRVV
ncbi:hypothetical protein HDU79_005280 [Rhizoclosmatium sp. JEL0117]|nr:hypothetical protein HDU79_005280 [Rhizoclosmatium sp. JEL0117]